MGNTCMKPPKVDLDMEISGNRCFDDDSFNCPSSCCMFTTNIQTPAPKLRSLKSVVHEVIEQKDIVKDSISAVNK